MMANPKLIQTSNGAGSSQQSSVEPELQPSVSCSSLKGKLGVDGSADEDTEISIFDAKRYFNESNGDARVCTRISPLLQDPISSELRCDITASALAGRFSSTSSAAERYGYGRSYRARSFHATPTASSEASWNSQTGLLSNPLGTIAVSMTMKTPTTTDHKRKVCGKLKRIWGRRCPCSGKKSVQVEPKTHLGSNQKHRIIHHDQKSPSWGDKHEEILLACNPHRITAENQFHSSFGQCMIASAAERTPRTSAGFTFPILNQQQPSSHHKMAAHGNQMSLKDHEDPPRESLEVFQPSDETPSISVPKKLMSRTTTADDDVGSDTSSDLFEIETFSTTTQSQTMSNPLYHRRDSLDEASNFNIRRSIAVSPSGNNSGFSCPFSPITTECYEPSEVSIDWSVTTAEGLERGYVGASEAEELNVTGTGAEVGNGDGKKKSGNGGLLSCRCEKAVSVGPNPVKYVPPHGQAATSSRHVGNVNKPPLARLSLPFAP